VKEVLLHLLTESSQDDVPCRLLLQETNHVVVLVKEVHDTALSSLKSSDHLEVAPKLLIHGNSCNENLVSERGE